MQHPSGIWSNIDSKMKECFEIYKCDPQLFQPQYKICPITEYYCKPNTDDIVAMVDATNVDDCNKECNKNEKCKIFTFLRLRGKGQCFLLKDCSEKVYSLQQNQNSLEINVSLETDLC